MSLPCLSFTEAEITSLDPNLTSTSVTACGVHWNFGLHSHSSLFPLTALVFSNSWDRKQKAFKVVRLRLCSKWRSWYVLMVLQTCHGSCACETAERPIGYCRDPTTAHFAEALMQAPANVHWTVNAALCQQSVNLELDHKGLGWHLELCEGFDSYYCRRVGFVEEKVWFLARQGREFSWPSSRRVFSPCPNAATDWPATTHWPASFKPLHNILC